tara:strand:+ start:2763 stop:2960 length:198 start_codon:yes stop_codon:yes gene_type:complete
MNAITKITLEKTKLIKELEQLIQGFKESKLIYTGTRSEEIILTIEIAKTEAKIEVIEKFTKIILS